MTHDLWSNLNRCIREYLVKVTLASLVEAQLAKSAATTVLNDRRTNPKKAVLAAVNAL